MSLIHDKYAGGGPCMIVSDKLWLCNAVDRSQSFSILCWVYYYAGDLKK